MIVHHLVQESSNLLIADFRDGGVELSVWDDGSMGDIFLDLPETIAVQSSLTAEVARNAALLDDEQLTAQVAAAQTHLDALNQEVARRILGRANGEVPKP